MKNFFKFFYFLMVPSILFINCSEKNDSALLGIYDEAEDDIAAIGKMNDELIKAQSEGRYAEVKKLFDAMNLKRAETQDRLNNLLSKQNGIILPFEQKNKKDFFEVKQVKAIGVIWNSNLNPNLIFSATVLLKDTLRDSFFGRWDFVNAENELIDNPAFYTPTKLIGTSSGEIVELKSNTTFSKIMDFKKFILR